MTIKSKRGRPIGTGKNDDADLQAVADALLRTPGLRPTTAYKRHRPLAGDADVRRIQVKWRANADALMANAQAKQDAQTRRAETSGRTRRRDETNALADLAREMSALSSSPALKAMADLQNSPAMQAMRDLQNSPALQAMADLQNSPAMQAMRDLHASPAMQAIQDLQNNPAMRAIREYQNSPALQAIRDYQNSPAMQAIREHQQMISRLKGF